MKGVKIVGPRTLAEVLTCMQEAGNKAVLLAGGTDWIIRQRRGTEAAQVIIDLSQVNELNYIRSADGYLEIGATVTFGQIAASPQIWAEARCLAQAAEQIGSQQIRNRATIGGNVANAAPAADSVPALLALDAEALLVKAGAEKRLAVSEVLPGICGGELAGWLIAGFRIPPFKGARSSFAKLGSRQSVSIAKLNLAMRASLDAGGKIQSAGMAIGAVAGTAIRLPAIEETLIGRSCNGSLAAVLADALVIALDGLIAGRASLPYKRQAVRGLAYDLADDLCGQPRERRVKNG